MIVCNDEESEQVCKVMNEFHEYRFTYIKVNHIEFTKQMVSRRVHVGTPMLQVESNCIKINGSDISGYSNILSGTRYVYEGEKLYTEIRKWYDNRLQKIRDEKLEEIFRYMKVKCINTSKYNKYDRLPLTVDKVYDVIEVTRIPFSARRYDDYSGYIYNLVNDNGEISGYSDECVRLLTVDEVRELKLEDLGI